MGLSPILTGVKRISVVLANGSGTIVGWVAVPGASCIIFSMSLFATFLDMSLPTTSVTS